MPKARNRRPSPRSTRPSSTGQDSGESKRGKGPNAATLDALFDVQEAKLSNGLRIRLVPNPSVPAVSLYTFFRVGSRNERPGITGISHLFEHMMFNGAKKYGPKMFDRVLESHGGRSNAYTSNDLTVYYEDFAPEALEKVLDLESDRMRSLAINDKMLKSEREVVLEERRMRIDNDIGGLMDEELGTLVFKAHPYRWPIIGWTKDIEAITREDCMEYFRTYYAPNNATLYIVGDIDPKRTLALIRRYYGDIPKGPPAPPVLDAEPDQKGERRAEVHHPAQAPALLIGYRGPLATEADALTLDIIQYALTVGEGSRLNRELVYKRELAVSVGMDWGWRIDRGVLLFFVELKPGSKPAEVEQALYELLAKLVAEGLTEREITKAKNNLKSHLLSEIATNNGRAHALGTYEALLGSWRAGLELPARYAAITQEQVRACAEKYFAPGRRSVVTLVPQAVVAGGGTEGTEEAA
ncbi:MAG TPA: pitrilysin family protein [Myxococcaceae bacterium]|nr:pitrilysin family protein [Myxococcaceae bacterium]